MKKFMIVMITCFAFSMMLVGCGPTKNVEPEPYTKMMECVEKEDLEHAKEFADVVIQDFKESEYIDNAYLIKNMIFCSKLELEYFKSNYLLQGIENLSTSLVEQSDIDDLKNYLQKSTEQTEMLSEPFCETLEYLLEHYEDADKVNLDFSEQAKGSTFQAENDLHPLAFFASVGYPVPTEAEMYDDDKQNCIKMFRTIKNGEDGNTAFSYPRYFSIAAPMCADEDMIKKTCEKIVEITEDDKYNVYRLDAEKYLKSLKN